LKRSEESGDITSRQRIAIINANTTAIAMKAAGVRKNKAMASAIKSAIAGVTDITAGSYIDHNGQQKSISKDDLDKATQLRITEIVNAKLPDGTDEQKLAAEIGMYSKVDVINERWKAMAGKAFDSLGTGDFVPDSPQFKATMQKFQFLKQLYAGNPQMFRKYLTDPNQRAQFADWQVMSMYGDSEQDALRIIGSPDYLKTKPTAADLNIFAEDVDKALDGWGWGDVVSGGEEENTLFRAKMIEYAKIIGKNTGMNPKQFVDRYAKEIVEDHSVVNGKLVFMGGAENIDNAKFQEDAQAYIAATIQSFGAGAFEPEQITLRYTGRGKTFWVVDQAGRVLPVAPLHLDSFYGLADRQERDAAQLEANNRQAGQ